MKTKVFFLIIFFMSLASNAQYSFSGHVDQDKWKNNVYLSVIDDYRKLYGVFSEQIISERQTDSTGWFVFTGDQLDDENRIYRIHVDNCDENEQNQNHFDGHCNDSKEILFIAKNTDTIEFPFSYDRQMFCAIESKNEKVNAFMKIDSLKEEMKFAYGGYRSEANRELNNKKWFKILQDFGQQLNEPLAELYIYAFLSERSNNFHSYYLEDLKTNLYYDNLLARLKASYPNSPYTKQYENEITSDKFSIQTTTSKDWPIYLLYIICGISLIANIILLSKLNKRKKNSITNLKSLLTKQEQNILALLLENKSNKDIARSLFVSLSTVKTHVNNIYKKLNVQSREEVKTLFNS